MLEKKINRIIHINISILHIILYIRGNVIGIIIYIYNRILDKREKKNYFNIINKEVKRNQYYLKVCQLPEMDIFLQYITDICKQEWESIF
jgi:hypothetical protein